MPAAAMSARGREPGFAASQIDTSRPHQARMYDAFLGGDNYPCPVKMARGIGFLSDAPRGAYCLAAGRFLFWRISSAGSTDLSARVAYSKPFQITSRYCHKSMSRGARTAVPAQCCRRASSPSRRARSSIPALLSMPVTIGPMRRSAGG